MPTLLRSEKWMGDTTRFLDRVFLNPKLCVARNKGKKQIIGLAMKRAIRYIAATNDRANR